MNAIYLMRIVQALWIGLWVMGAACAAPVMSQTQGSGDSAQTERRSAPVAVASQAQGIFAQVKDSVVQIRTVLRGSQSQNSIGSGFYVSEDGLVMTNYHVVSSYALGMDKYDLEYVENSGAHGKLTLLAIDVLHDLALLSRPSTHNLPYLRFHEDAVQKGEKFFSLGNPNDLGQIIVEGVNNGLREHAFYDAIHFTGAINGGMSGGPVVNQMGKLVGINEASMGQSRGFLVPARFALALLARWYAHPVAVPQFRPEVTRQLKEHSAALTARLMQKPSLPVQWEAGFAIPDAADPYMRCWANERNDTNSFFTSRSYYCSGQSDVYVERGMVMGSVSFESTLYQTETLDSFRFGRVLTRSYGLSRDEDDPPREQFSQYACTDSVIELKGKSLKAALCVHAYRKFPGLYDMKLGTVSLNKGKTALISKLSINGLTYEDGMRMVKFYMEALK